MRVLLISPVPTHPANAGNCIRILNLMLALEQLGHEPHLLHVSYQSGNHEAMHERFGNRFHPYAYQKPWRKYRLGGLPIPDRISRQLAHRGYLAQTIDQFYDDGLSQFVVELHERFAFQAVMVEYVFFSKALCSLPNNIRKLIDTHDVYTDRHKLLRRSGLTADWFFTNRQEEAKGLRRADVILAIQNCEQEKLTEIIERKREVITVGHLIEPVASPLPPLQKTVLMVGSNNPLNVCYFQQFIDECWAPFHQAHSDCRLKIAGSVGPKLKAPQSVQIVGFVEDLKGLYAQTNVVVNPLLTGTGLKIKSLEALAHGRPLLSTPVGLEGLSNAIGQGAIVANDFPAMRQALGKLMQDCDQQENLSKSALQFAAKYKQQQLDALQQALAVKRVELE